MIIHDASVDSIDHLIRQNHKQASKRPCCIADPGQFSSPITLSDDEFYCTICMERRPSACKFGIGSCCHAFCLSCIGQYVAAKIDENTVHVRCPEAPDPGCRDGAVEPQSCRGVIPSELFNKWGFTLFESALRAKRLYRPVQGLLGASPLRERGGAPQKPRARTAIGCSAPGAWCRVTTASATEFQELGEDECGREDVLVRRLAGREDVMVWQRCPRCSVS